MRRHHRQIAQTVFSGFLGILCLYDCGNMYYGTTMIEVDSSAIRAIGYHAGTMTVLFHSGRDYDFPDFPYAVFLEFLNAPSKGEYFNHYIRGKYNQ